MKRGMIFQFLIIFILLLIIIFSIVFYQFFYNSTELQQTASKPQEIAVGWIGPVTGPVKVIGVDNLKAVRLAFKNVSNDTPRLKLLIADDQYDTNKCVAEYKKMVNQVKLTAVFISAYSCVVAIAKEAEKNSVIIINPIDNDTSLANLNTPWRSNVFLIAKETENLAAIDANALMAQGRQNTLVIYYGGDNFMPNLAQTVEKILTYNGKKVHLIKYMQGVTDFRDYLAWGKKNNVDSYVFFGYVELGFAMKQAREMGITAPFYSVNVITDPLFLKNAAGAANGTYFAHFTAIDGIQSNADKFKKLFWQQYSTYPIVEWTAMQAYDASNILIDSIKTAYGQQGNFNANLREILQSTSDYQGVSGTITIQPNGSSQGIYPSLYILKNGRSERIK